MIAEFNKKEKRRFLGFSLFFKIGSVLLILFSIFLAYSDIKIYKKQKQLSLETINYQKQLKEIQEKNKSLEQGINQSDDAEYIEKVAREELGMQKPGEKVVAFVNQEQKPEDLQTQNQQESKPNPWFGWITQSWNWILSKF